MPRQGVNLIGFLNHVLGLGESARQFQAALRAAAIPHAAAAIGEHGLAPRLPGPSAPWLGETELPFDVTILWCNPDLCHEALGATALPGRWVVGRWAWELSSLPDAWRRAATLLDEIWTPSRFVAAAVRGAVQIPVRVIPMAVQASPVAPLDRGSWHLPVDRHLFLFMFDHFSLAARKNPLGVVSAFRQAFADRDDVFLLIKTINASHMPDAAGELEAAVAGDESIRVLDVALSASERSALLAACDCYVSLHRSEGFGMTIAEAMAYGRPVIATNYGGVLDYFDEHTGYPVDWRAVRVGIANAPFPPDGIWAEPDLTKAARLMRRVVDRPAEALERGRRAAARIESAHGTIDVGHAIARELERIRAQTA